MNYFIILLIIILIIVYLTNFMGNENFTSGYDTSFSDYESVNYNTRKQNCNELTYTPEECIVDTVIPSNKIVCNESLIPNTNNQKDYENTNISNEKNPTLGLKYDFNLLSSFNKAQINGDENIKLVNNNISELETFDDLKTDIRSLASLENDLISNY